MRVTATALFVLAAAGSVAIRVETAHGQVALLGPEITVNTETEAGQNSPMAMIRDDGAFVIVWRDEFSQAIEGQRFNRSGQALGGAFPVSDPASYAGFPSAAMTSQGDFVVTWGRAQGVNAQRFDRSGNPQGAPFLVGVGGYYGHHVAKAASGDFVVTWTDYGLGMNARLYDAEGVARGPQFRIVSETARPWGVPPLAAMAADGRFVAIWTIEKTTHDLDLVGRLFDASGAPVATELQVNRFTTGFQAFPSVATTPDGQFVVVWSSHAQDGDQEGVFGQRFDPQGRRTGSEFQVNTRTQQSQTRPEVTMNSGGSFVVTWISGDQYSERSVLAQLFDPNGSRVSGEIEIHAPAALDGNPASVALAKDGTGVVTWASRSGDMTFDVRARRFRIAAAGEEDSDGDGVPLGVDNCPTVANADQADAQGDGHGDACVAPDVVLPSDLRLGANPVIGTGTKLETRVAIGDDAVIGELVTVRAQVRAGVRLRAEDLSLIGRRAVLGDDVTLGFASLIDAAVTIEDGVTLGDGAKVRRDVIVARGATIGPFAIVFAGARIGAGATIEDGARVGRRATVLPGAVLPAGTSVPPGATFP